MADFRALGAVSNLVRFTLKHATTGQGLTGLTSASSGLIISTIADNEASPTVYTVAGSTIESVTTLGSFSAPTATKCRFKLVSDTNHPGLVEMQFADARYAVAGAKQLVITVSGAANLLTADYQIDFSLAGWLRAMMRDDSALTPADVGGTFDNQDSSLEASPFEIV